MSAHGVHVPHHHEGPVRGFTQWVAIFTALMATVGAVVGHEASEVANEAILLKNDAVLNMAKASNQWGYYQSVSTKAHLMELSRELTPQDSPARMKADEKLAKYAAQKQEIEEKARKLEAQVSADVTKSGMFTLPRQQLGYSLALFQIAISVASLTVLTGRLWLFGVALLAAAGGIGYWLVALVAH